MAPKITDPVSFLNNLLVKKGKSELYGVYLTGVNVLANAREDYGYNLDTEHVEQDLDRLLSHEKDDWNSLLVETRRGGDEIVFPISFIKGREPITTYFVVEGHEMSSMVFIPSVVVDEFANDVVFYQHLLKNVAEFAGKTPTNIRFVIGSASMQWGDLVERGCAREVDLSF